MQASLEETQSEQKQTAYAAELLRQGASHEPATTSTMGLRNATGEYNCFLNVIIQCMWHCHVFRQAVMSWDAAAYQVLLHCWPHYLHLCNDIRAVDGSYITCTFAVACWYLNTSFLVRYLTCVKQAARFCITQIADVALQLRSYIRSCSIRDLGLGCSQCLLRPHAPE